LRAAMPNLTGAGVSVGVIDTGIQSGHPEFNGTIGSVTFVDFVNNLTSPYDDMGHGTHVSGTIAGNQVGIAPQVNLYSAKALNALGQGYDSWLIEAMQWMFNPSGDPTSTAYPQVVSCSWGMDLQQDGMDISNFLPYELALQAWVNGGIIPVFAAGNAGTNPNGVPGGLPEAIAVGAIAQGDVSAYFSSLGPNMWRIGQLVLTFSKPDISAPGVGITSAFPGNQYVTWDGTSMATPHVTGTIALMLQANPKLAYADVKQILELNSDLKLDNTFGYGIDNAYNAVMAAINGGTSSSKKKVAHR
jgi:subtilisin family serine protease